jgi:hypothetical protein
MLLGELLVAQGLATTGEIKNALALQERYGGRVGDHLIDMGVLSKETLEAALRRQYEQAVAILAREDLLARSLRHHGNDHPQTHRQRSQLASVLITVGRRAEALDLAQRAFAGLAKTVGPEHPWTKQAERVVTDAAMTIEEPKSPRQGPAVAPRVGAGEQHAVFVAADDLDAARPF